MSPKFNCLLERNLGFPNDSSGKEYTCNAGDIGDMGLSPGLGRSPWGRKWQTTPIFLSEKSHGQRTLAGYCPKGLKELDMTKQKPRKKSMLNRGEGKLSSWILSSGYFLNGYVFLINKSRHKDGIN